MSGKRGGFGLAVAGGEVTAGAGRRAPPAEAPDGLPPGQRRWAVLTVALAILMAVLDSAIANVALPTIALDLHASPAESIWVVNAYQLAVTISLLPLASLGEIIGYRRVYQTGLAVFTLASLACALSGSLTGLTLARVLQGFGAAGIMSVNTALLRFIYPQHGLGRGLAFNTVIVAMAAALGPTVAAAILSAASWPWLFAVNGPIGLLAFLIALCALPSTPRAPHRFDVVSAGLSALTFGLLVTAIGSFGHGLGWRVGLPGLAASVAFGAVLVRRQLAQTAPLLPVDLLRIPVFALSACTSVFSFAAQSLALVSLPFLLQTGLGHGPVATGLLMTPWPLGVALAAPVAGRLSDRTSAGMLGGVGLAALTVGLLCLCAMPAAPTAMDLIWRTALCGLGFGTFQAPNNRAMLTAAPRHRSGGASGMLGTSRLLGQTTGAALVALVFGLAPGHGPEAALVVAAGFAVVAAPLSALRARG